MESGEHREGEGPAPAPPRSSNTLTRVLGAVAIVGLLGGVLYITSTLHFREFRLRVASGQLLVERGRFFPVGYAPYVPPTKALADAYAPIAVPPGAAVDTSQVLDDAMELDRALCSLLGQWVREATAKGEFAQGLEYLRRADLLPNLDDVQRKQLRTLRGALALEKARRLVAEGLERLKLAQGELRVARENDPSPEALNVIHELERTLANCEGRSLTPPASMSDTASKTQTAVEQDRQSGTAAPEAADPNRPLPW